jgi:hypothetical protein
MYKYDIQLRLYINTAFMFIMLAGHFPKSVPEGHLM